ncbi:MAG TPA: LuxR C-terminal-related transcriptional regulator, partial [Gemmataceae bacterium]|nr:LuxR C-terminal-related transcriptional regulator [Gemmataceae bacterium]
RGLPCMTASEAREAYERLTPRLKDVLVMVADGHSSKAIATKLNISLKTVEFHRRRLHQQLGIRGDALLARFAVRVGVVAD